MTRKAITVFFLLFLSIEIIAQYSVNGILYDRNNKVIPEVHITIKGDDTDKTTKTNANGQFSFSNVLAGNYVLTFSKNGTKEEEHITLSANLSKSWIFSLYDQNIKHIEEVSFSKLRSVKSEIEKKGFAVNVIEMKDFTSRNMQTVEVLDQTVGVRIRQNGGLGSGIAFNINGMTGNSIRILIDGIPSTSYGASFDINSIPPAMIDRIEVYKGVLPGYIADDALGGAINIILKKEAGNTLGLSLSYGSFNTLQTNFNGSYRAKKGFTANVSGFYNYSDNDYKIWGRGIYNIAPNGMVIPTEAKRFNDVFDSKGTVIETGFTKVKWADQFLLGYTHSESYKEVQHGLFMARPYKGRFTEANLNVFSLNYKKTNLVKNLDVGINALYSIRERKVNDTVTWLYNWDGNVVLGLFGEPLRSPYGAQQGQPTLMTSRLKTFSTRTALTYHLNKQNRFILNYLFQNIDRVDDDAARTIQEREYIGTRNLSKSNASLTYELNAFKDKLKISVFGKYYEQNSGRMDPVVRIINGESVRVEERENRKVSAEGYGVAASYLLNPALVLLTSAEKAVRLPNENELFGDPGENIVQNFTLRPELSNNVNLGFKAGTFRYREHQFSVSVNAFLRDTKDKIMRFVISNNINEASQSLPYVNYLATKSTGMDVELMYSFHRKLFINYNISRFKTVFNRSDDSYKGMQVPNEPYFTMNGALRYVFDNVFAKGSRFNLFYSYRNVKDFNSFIPRSGNIGGVDHFKIPEQNIHDVGVGYQFPKKDFIVSFDSKNIFNRQVYDNFAVQRPGRAFYLKINYNLINLNK
ncbi:TonB-dependent receptor [Elizabethkingia anophelis]|nr:TonB-dependent receptor [Elizabethkingia anophelis]